MLLRTHRVHAHAGVNLRNSQGSQRSGATLMSMFPERWVEGSPLEATDVQKKAFMPFGDGIRACVGEKPLMSWAFERSDKVLF